MRGIIILMLVALLSGCFGLGTKTDYVEIPDTFVHPQRPDPVAPYAFNWNVLVIDGKPFVGLEYGESIEFRLFLEDFKRYVEESNALLCFYRVDLKETNCVGVQIPAQ